jgi:hypothetical protein
MVFPNSPFAVAVGSFTEPVEPPTVDADAAPLVYIGLNCEWLPYICGALTQLLLQSTWKVTNDAELSLVQQRVFDLIALFVCKIAATKDTFLIGSSGPDVSELMIRQNPDNPCLLETSIDGINWCAFADLSKCIPPGQSPGTGANQPAPGQCVAYNMKLPANGSTVIPVPLSEGDTVFVDVVDGAVNDNTIAWWTERGRIYFAGEEQGPVVYVPGDPVSLFPHAALIGSFDGGATFFAVGEGLFTVPSGISNKQLAFFVNFPMDLPRNGEYTFLVNVCNNAPPEWHSIIDFRVGFPPSIFIDFGDWEPSVGLHGVVNGGVPAWAQVRVECAATEVTRMLMTYDADTPGGTSNVVFFQQNGAGYGTPGTTLDGDGNLYDVIEDDTGVTELILGLSGGTTGVSVTLLQWEIIGKGVKPAGLP